VRSFFRAGIAAGSEAAGRAVGEREVAREREEAIEGDILAGLGERRRHSRERPQI
jgi:hypothetical protein